MILRKSRLQKSRRGVTAVEAAFVLGILVLFMIGILEYARYLFFMHVATNATAAAARFAVAHTGDGTTITQVQQTATDQMNSQQNMVSGYTVSVFAAQPGVSPPTPISGTAWNDAVFGGGICVRITGTYTFLSTSLLGLNGVPINVSAVMTSEAN
jgi:Flp pilus assembly protein TadG